MTGEDLRALVADAENTARADGASAADLHLLAPLRRFAAGYGSDDLVDLAAFGLIADEVAVRVAQETALAMLQGPHRAEALAFLRRVA